MDDPTAQNSLCNSLKERLRQGDEAVLAEVMQAYAPRLAAAIRLRFPVFAAADVDDVLSVTFFRLWQGRQRLDPASGRLMTLLRRIAFHVAREVCRFSGQKAGCGRRSGSNNTQDSVKRHVRNRRLRP